MTNILFENINSNDLEILLEDSTKRKIITLKSSLKLIISHMLKYKYKRRLQTNSWINTIINNYNKIYEIINTNSVINRFSENDYNTLYNKIYEDYKKLLNRIKELKIKK